MMKRKYGWKRDHPDHRDRVYGVAAHVMQTLPRKVDLRVKCPDLYNQADSNTCTGQSTGFAIHYDRGIESPGVDIESLQPSALFPYYNGRTLDHSEDMDGGCQIRNVMKGLNKYGYCDEELWPFDLDKICVRPATAAYEQASHRDIVDYRRVGQSADLIRAALASERPVIFGISIYTSFESDQVATSGEIPMPGSKESFLGGHAIAAVGYDDDLQLVIFRNSWGIGWGDRGYGYLPYRLVFDPNLAADFWTVKTVPQ
jgi:C1A family cysteine protease